MLTVEFDNGTKIYVMILDKAAGKASDVWGIAQCAHCDGATVLQGISFSAEEVAKTIETFAHNHHCNRVVSKEQLLEAMARERKRRYAG